MRNGFTFFLFLALLMTVCVFQTRGAEYPLAKVIKARGGGGVDIAELAATMPDTAQLLISVNFEKLAETDLMEKYGSLAGPVAPVVEGMGLHIGKNVKHLVVGVTFDDEPEYYGVVIGDVDESKIVPILKENMNRFDEKDWDGRKVYFLNDSCVTFTDKGVLFSGHGESAEDNLKKMLKPIENSLASSKAMAELVARTDTKAPVWGTFIFSEKMLKEMAEDSDDEVPFDVSNMRTANFSADYGEKATFASALYFTNGEDAASLAKFLKDQLDALAPVEGIPAGAKEIMKALKIAASGKAATMEFSMDSGKLQEAVTSIKESMGSM